MIMDANKGSAEAGRVPELPETPEPSGAVDAPQAPDIAPIESRFLFVDVAAQRTNQLRRGALPRLPQLRPDPVTGVRPQGTMKLERVAMEEVRQGLITYELPTPKPTPSGKAV